MVHGSLKQASIVEFYKYRRDIQCNPKKGVPIFKMQ